MVTWESVPGRNYSIEGSADPTSPASFHPLATNIPSLSGTTTYTHANAVGAKFSFYRVGVE